MKVLRHLRNIFCGMILFYEVACYGNEEMRRFAREVVYTAYNYNQTYSVKAAPTWGGEDLDHKLRNDPAFKSCQKFFSNLMKCALGKADWSAHYEFSGNNPWKTLRQIITLEDAAYEDVREDAIKKYSKDRKQELAVWCLQFFDNKYLSKQYVTVHHIKDFDFNDFNLPVANCKKQPWYEDMEVERKAIK